MKQPARAATAVRLFPSLAGSALAACASAALTLSTGCASRDAAGGAEAAPNAGAALLEVDGKRLARAELPAEVQGALHEIESESFERTSAVLTEYAVRSALAKEKGVSVASSGDASSLIDLLAVQPPSEEALKAFYESNKERIPPGTSFEEVKPRIAEYLGQKAAADAFRARAADLESKGAFRVLARAPEAPAVPLDVAGFPSRGPADAKVVVVEVSDYLCPHCKDAQAQVESILASTGGRVRFVQVNFALRPDGLSGALVKGAHCASAQGDAKFWAWHTAAFNANQAAGKGDDAIVKGIADSVGLARPAFDACLASPETARAMNDAVTRMAAAGVKGTPTFFVNGRKVELPALKGTIERELGRAGVASR